MPGPVPKKKSELRRRNKDGAEVQIVNLDEAVLGEVEIPLPSPDWEPFTKDYYASFARSGQAMFMEPTDWATAWMLMEVLDRWLKPQDIRVGEIRPAADMGGEVTYLFEPKIVPMPGTTLNSILKGLASLMALEGDRRRLKLELERRKAMETIAEGANVVSIVAKRSQLFEEQRDGS